MSGVALQAHVAFDLARMLTRLEAPFYPDKEVNEAFIAKIIQACAEKSEIYLDGKIDNESAAEMGMQWPAWSAALYYPNQQGYYDIDDFARRMREHFDKGRYQRLGTSQVWFDRPDGIIGENERRAEINGQTYTLFLKPKGPKSGS